MSKSCKDFGDIEVCVGPKSKRKAPAKKRAVKKAVKKVVKKAVKKAVKKKVVKKVAKKKAFKKPKVFKAKGGYMTSASGPLVFKGDPRKFKEPKIKDRKAKAPAKKRAAKKAPAKKRAAKKAPAKKKMCPCPPKPRKARKARAPAKKRAVKANMSQSLAVIPRPQISARQLKVLGRDQVRSRGFLNQVDLSAGIAIKGLQNPYVMNQDVLGQANNQIQSEAALNALEYYKSENPVWEVISCPPGCQKIPTKKTRGVKRGSRRGAYKKRDRITKTMVPYTTI